MLGAISALSLVAALFFARFYRDAREPLFLYFAAAFGLEGVNLRIEAIELGKNLLCLARRRCQHRHDGEQQKTAQSECRHERGPDRMRGLRSFRNHSLT